SPNFWQTVRGCVLRRAAVLQYDAYNYKTSWLKVRERFASPIHALRHAPDVSPVPRFLPAPERRYLRHSSLLVALHETLCVQLLWGPRTRLYASDVLPQE